MDNRVFNVNGPLSQPELLRQAIRLAFAQGGRNRLAKFWKVTESGSLLFLWYDDGRGTRELPTPLDADGAFEVAHRWLADEARFRTAELKDWDRDYDHDGHNDKGWRVYVEGWGHVDGHSSAICAITPAYMWYGK